MPCHFCFILMWLSGEAPNICKIAIFFCTNHLRVHVFPTHFLVTSVVNVSWKMNAHLFFFLPGTFSIWFNHFKRTATWWDEDFLLNTPISSNIRRMRHVAIALFHRGQAAVHETARAVSCSARAKLQRGRCTRKRTKGPWIHRGSGWRSQTGWWGRSIACSSNVKSNQTRNTIPEKITSIQLCWWLTQYFNFSTLRSYRNFCLHLLGEMPWYLKAIVNLKTYFLFKKGKKACGGEEQLVLQNQM